MKFTLKATTILFSLFIVLSSCQSRQKVAENLAPNAHQVTAEEVIQTSSYTYVRVMAEGRDYWIAISKAEVKEGETYFWSVGTPMKDFTSKELKRTFRTILFVQDFTDKPITLETEANAGTQQSMPGVESDEMPTTAMPGRQPNAEKTGITVPRAEGGITIAELFAKRKNYAGKSVRIRGEVVRFAPAIMSKNWVHLQDGTKDGNNFDLTVTTNDSIAVGKVALFQGVVTLEKDFGAGYKYEVIMEDAKLLKK